ncbi:hypothetical protein [Paenibacillus dauci]|uniref:hypothetical protein n=1 Tax=Paenibacillus dauci TaxID=1567106 RepID=UPI00061933B7|nr:hypothetical protein [Paenibacillus dauci]
MGMTGIYYVEKENLQTVLAGDPSRPDLDIDKTWSLIADMFPDIPFVPVQDQYKIDSQLTEFGTFYLPPHQVAQMAESIPVVRQREALEQRIDFDRWKASNQQSPDDVEDHAMMIFFFAINENDTYEEIVEDYLMPYLNQVFDLYLDAASKGQGIVFAIF